MAAEAACSLRGSILGRLGCPVPLRMAIYLSWELPGPCYLDCYEWYIDGLVFSDLAAEAASNYIPYTFPSIYVTPQIINKFVPQAALAACVQ